MVRATTWFWGVLNRTREQALAGSSRSPILDAAESRMAGSRFISIKLAPGNKGLVDTGLSAGRRIKANSCCEGCYRGSGLVRLKLWLGGTRILPEVFARWRSRRLIFRLRVKQPFFLHNGKALPGRQMWRVNDTMRGPLEADFRFPRHRSAKWSRQRSPPRGATAPAAYRLRTTTRTR